MLDSLLATKLYFPPVRPKLVARPHLVKWLENGLSGRLTLISAPAGYGKTTLMSEWRAGPGAERPATWLALDAADNDLLRFFQYLIAALDTLQPGIEREIHPLLEVTQELNSDAILTTLVNALGESPCDFVLVMDDYHVIETTAIHTALAFLLDHLPPRVHLVILTRLDPPLPLARLRARGQLTEIRVEQLRFGMDEAAEFLNRVTGLNLSGEQVAALEARSEGWIAGLQLAAISMQGREDLQDFVLAFTGSHRYIVDYLADEVLNSQTEVAQEFLLRTSILDRLTASLCNVLTDRTDGQAMLEKLEHANLFLIPLDDERRWYRYHHLFKEMLRGRLQRIYPEKISDLHHRAADWLEQNSFFEEALNCSIYINDFETAARLLSDHRQQILRQRTIKSVLTLMNNFPDALIRGDPRLSLIYALNLWLSGLRNEAEPYVLNAHQAMSRQARSAVKMDPTPSYNALVAEATALRSLVALHHGEMEDAIRYAKQAVDIVPPDEYFAQGMAYVSLYNAYREMGRMEEAIQACTLAIDANRLGHSLALTVDAIFNLGRLLKIQGRLHTAEQIYLDGIHVAESKGQAGLPTYSLVHFGLAELYYQWNNLDETECQLDLGFGLLKYGSVLLISRIGHILLAQLKHARGDIQGALQILQEIELEAHREGITTYLNEVAAYKAVIQAKSGDANEAENWVKTIELGTVERLGYQKGVQAIQLARVFIAIENFDEALDLLSRIEKFAEVEKSISWQIEALVLQSKAWQKRSDSSQAINLLEKALSLAEHEGFVRVFLDEGEPVVSLLQHVATKGVHLEYVSRLLSAASLEDKNSLLTQPLIEPLSERELEVLRLVADGLSNRQIADALVIAVGTVKKHINNIFGKLGVQSRTHCVARARELNLF